MTRTGKHTRAPKNGVDRTRWNIDRQSKENVGRANKSEGLKLQLPSEQGNAKLQMFGRLKTVIKVCQFLKTVYEWDFGLCTQLPTGC
ncbi:hypothetical protein DP116_16250 [Brasilonema bromeliae SPC951]|uniref:Transposase n=1 Tax=Brasilonema bromeliae SPC951 TaxID=385972 RepID=A0ABX1PAK2_9CYAN|nr:hypothetical protein [Brasilonema bromeliae SPC951]